VKSTRREGEWANAGKAELWNWTVDGEGSALRSGFSSPGKRVKRSTHWIGGWLGFRAGLDTGVANRIIPMLPVDQSQQPNP
jgi:hypothetical protein